MLARSYTLDKHLILVGLLAVDTLMRGSLGIPFIYTSRQSTALFLVKHALNLVEGRQRVYSSRAISNVASVITTYSPVRSESTRKRLNVQLRL